VAKFFAHGGHWKNNSQLGLGGERPDLYASQTPMTQLQQAQPDLETLLAQKTAELEDTQARLQSALEQLEEERRVKGRFLSTLAHELRNPLASLHSGFSLLQRAKNTDDRLVAQVQPLMKQQLGHATRLIEELGDLAQARGGKLVLRREVFSLQAAADMAAATARPYLAAQEQSLQLLLDTPACWIVGDKARTAQALANLLIEASRQATIGGAWGLAVRHFSGKGVALMLETDGDVTDDVMRALARPPAPQDDLFATLDGELGIGPSLALHVVAQQGGSAWCRERGGGAEATGRLVVVQWPLAPQEPPGA
jgi:signal transduction histidine kinase